MSEAAAPSQRRRGRPPRIHGLETAAPAAEKEGTPQDKQVSNIRFYYPDLSGLSDDELLKAAALSWRFGLDPSGVGGLSRLVASGGHAAFVIGYRGLIGLAMASGAFRLMEARVVRDKDTFALDHGSQILRHAPFAEDGDPGPIVGAYGLSIENSGSFRCEFVPGRAILGLSPTGLSDAEEVAKKGAIVRLAANSPVDMPQLRYALDAEMRSLVGLPIPD